METLKTIFHNKQINNTEKNDRKISKKRLLDCEISNIKVPLVLGCIGVRTTIIHAHCIPSKTTKEAIGPMDF
jgi:hypothetical protein